MKNLLILLAIMFSITLKSQGLLDMKHYVPLKLQEAVIAESECPERINDTSWYASIPFENKNYVYKITNKPHYTEFQEISMVKLHPSYIKIIGIPLFFIVYGLMLFVL